MTRKKRLGLLATTIAAGALVVPAAGLAGTPVPDPPSQPQLIPIKQHILDHVKAIGPSCVIANVASVPDFVSKGGRPQTK